jgi:peptide/nickel transport system ATP-binding protein
MTDLVLDVRNLQVEFTSDDKLIKAVDRISFTLKRGEKLGIVGESGSGKSVTSLALMGLIQTPGKISDGEIWYREENTTAVNFLELKEEKRRLYRGNKVAMIFQEPMSALNPVYDIGFQITEAILLHQKVSDTEARRQAIGLLQEVKLIPRDEELREQYLAEKKQTPVDREVDDYINERKRTFLKRYPHELSGGQLQRVTIAMAISCSPTVLIADEPTTALDVTVQATILDLLRELCRDRGMSLIFITHDLGVIAELVDRVAVMYRGKIVEVGEIEEIFNNPQHPYTKGLLACRPSLDRKLRYLPTVADFLEVETDDRGEIIIKEKNADWSPEKQEVITLQQQQERWEKLKKQENPILVSVNGLRVGFPVKGVFGGTKSYFMAVNDVSFEVYRGETLGLVGESGCGKSTLARTLMLLIPSIQGRISFDGQNVSQLLQQKREKAIRRLRKDIQIIFQNPYSSLNPRMSIGKAISEPLSIHNPQQTEKERRDRVGYLLERVGLDPKFINRFPHEFSGGQRQRICIARALALNPRFIICDESVSALDVSVQAQVLNLLKELQKEFELTYIFISHDLSVVKFMSDRIMVMNQGQIVESNTAEEIYQNPQTDYTRQLIAAIPTGKIDKHNYET